MRIRHRLGEHDHDRITADVGASPADLALRIEHDAIGPGVAPDDPILARKALRRHCRIGRALGEFLAGDASDQPGIAAELLMDLLEQITRALWSPAARQSPAIDARGHQADDVRFHASSCRRGWEPPNIAPAALSTKRVGFRSNALRRP